MNHAYPVNGQGADVTQSSLIFYASRTGTRRNLAAFERAGWRLLVSAAACLRTEGFPYALDNGAWSYFQKGRPFDERRFAVALRKLGAGADWTVPPDIVAGGHRSLELSMRWLRLVLDESPRALLAVQDGMEPGDVRHLLGPRVGIFIGGSTPWKLRTLAGWAALGLDAGCWVHLARVNSARRLAHAAAVGTTSADGTSGSRYSVNTPRLAAAMKHQPLPLAYRACASCGHNESWHAWGSSNLGACRQEACRCEMYQ